MSKAFIILIFSIFIASVSQILLKKSSNKKYDSFIKEYLNAYVISGYILLLISTIFTVVALKGLDYNNIPIMESSGYLMVMVLSYFFLSEKITKKKVIGNIIILLGIIIYYIR